MDGVNIRIFENPITDGDQFNIKATILRPISVEWEENFFGGGRFTIVYPLSGEHVHELQLERFVLIDNYYGGWIDKIDFAGDNSGTSISVSGFDCLSYFENRTIIPPDLTSFSGMAGFDAQEGSTEKLIKHYINASLVGSEDISRRVPGFRIAANQDRGKQDDKMAARYEFLAEITRELATYAQLGIIYSVDVSQGTITYDCAVGVNRTAGQTVVAPIIFEFQRQNIENLNLTLDDTTMRNVFYTTMAGAEFEDEALTLTYWREQDKELAPSGFSRRETHMEISVGTPTAGEEYNELRRLAILQMTQYESTENFTARINPGRMPYRKYFFLGDIVTVQDKAWGITMDAQITGMTTRVDETGKSFTATFGNGRPNAFSIIKRDLRKGR